MYYVMDSRIVPQIHLADYLDIKNRRVRIKSVYRMNI